MHNINLVNMILLFEHNVNSGQPALSVVGGGVELVVVVVVASVN